MLFYWICFSICADIALPDQERQKNIVRNNMRYCMGELSLALAFGGIVIFLMHWETSPGYITNFVPVIILLADRRHSSVL